MKILFRNWPIWLEILKTNLNKSLQGAQISTLQGAQISTLGSG
jgi:hypothetical protein